MIVASLPIVLRAQLLLTAHRNVRMRQLGDLPGHEFHGNQWKENR